MKIKEGKTKKERMINLTSVLDEVYSYAKTLESTWLFASRKGEQPISKIQTYRQLQKNGDFADIEFIGTHTMRKTFRYWFYKQTKDSAILQGILNHTTQQITLKYIGINKEKRQYIFYLISLSIIHLKNPISRFLISKKPRIIK